MTQLKKSDMVPGSRLGAIEDGIMWVGFVYDEDTIFWECQNLSVVIQQDVNNQAYPYRNQFGQYYSFASAVKVARFRHELAIADAKSFLKKYGEI